MARVNVVTGVASGIGKATAELFEGRGERVIGIDIKDAEIVADLSTVDGRQHMIDEVTRISGGSVDTLIAVAGISAPIAATVAINYFGAVATLDGMRPLLAGSDSPRAVAVSSMASLQPNRPELVDACLAGDETSALALAEAIVGEGAAFGYDVYPSSKAAISRWVRRNAPTDPWAGAGIALNAVAPGVVLTPMTEPLLATEEGRAMVFGAAPSPLGGASEATDIAESIAFLASPVAKHICGQVLFSDSGCDVVKRGDSTW